MRLRRKAIGLPREFMGRARDLSRGIFLAAGATRASPPVKVLNSTDSWLSIR